MASLLDNSAKSWQKLPRRSGQIQGGFGLKHKTALRYTFSQNFQKWREKYNIILENTFIMLKRNSSIVEFFFWELYAFILRIATQNILKHRFLVILTGNRCYFLKKPKKRKYDVVYDVVYHVVNDVVNDVVNVDVNGDVNDKLFSPVALQKKIFSNMLTPSGVVNKLSFWIDEFVFLEN